MIDSVHILTLRKLYVPDPKHEGVISGGFLRIFDKDGNIASEFHGKVGSAGRERTYPTCCQVIGRGPFTHEFSYGAVVDYDISLESHHSTICD